MEFLYRLGNEKDIQTLLKGHSSRFQIALAPTLNADKNISNFAVALYRKLFVA